MIDLGVSGTWFRVLLKFSNLFLISLNEPTFVSCIDDDAASVLLLLLVEFEKSLFILLLDSRLTSMRLAAFIISLLDILLAELFIDLLMIELFLFSLLLLPSGDAVISDLLLLEKLIICILGEQYWFRWDEDVRFARRESIGGAIGGVLDVRLVFKRILLKI